mmetsp:Transcript_26225/g.49813  ORF Transcript_26225/g.49813 Transcript_26225/m.49813 type:complete len:254 (-) Transcript_26225:1319-2080(-)
MVNHFESLRIRFHLNVFFDCRYHFVGCQRELLAPFPRDGRDVEPVPAPRRAAVQQALQPLALQRVPQQLPCMLDALDAFADHPAVVPELSDHLLRQLQGFVLPEALEKRHKLVDVQFAAVVKINGLHEPARESVHNQRLEVLSGLIHHALQLVQLHEPGAVHVPLDEQLLEFFVHQLGSDLGRQAGLDGARHLQLRAHAAACAPRLQSLNSRSSGLQLLALPLDFEKLAELLPVHGLLVTYLQDHVRVDTNVA